MKSLLSAMCVLVLGACQIDPADVPQFGGPCSNSCDNGFRCDKKLDACVPDDGTGPEPPKAGSIDAFSVDPQNIAPGEQVTFTWESEHTADCAVTPGLGPVDTSGTLAITVDVAGDFAFTLECVGDDGEPVQSEPVQIHVRLIHEGDLLLGSQADVAAAVGVEEVNGNVISTSAAIGDLDPLSLLREVRGDVLFDTTTGLATVAFPALERITGGLRIVNADETLTGIDLGALTTVGTDFTLLQCPKVAVLDANALETVGGNLTVGGYEYPDFPNIDNFTGGGLPELNVLGLASLRTIGGWLDVEEDYALETLTLPALESIGGLFAIYALRGATLVSLPELQSIGGGVLIARSPLLATLLMPKLESTGSVRDHLTEIYEIFYTDVPDASFFRAGDWRLDGNSAVEDQLPEDNSAISDINLSALRTVDGRLMLQGTRIAPATQGQPVDFDLNALTEAGGLLLDLTISDQVHVHLASLVRVGAGGLYEPYSDNVLIGLEALEEVDGDFIVSSTALPDLPSLTRIGGQLEVGNLGDVGVLARLANVEEIAVLSMSVAGGTSFSALAALTTVGRLSVTNSTFTSLGLDDVTTLAGSSGAAPTVSLANNPALVTAALPSLIGAVPGNVRVEGNNALTTVDLGAAASIAGDLVLDGDAIATVRACSLGTVGDELRINDTLLASLDGFDALTTLQTLTVTANTALAQCHVALLGEAATVTTVNTGNTATNPDPCDDLGAEVCP